MEKKFEIVLQKDEKIKWCNKVNVFASVLKGILPAILIGGFISVFITLFLGTFFFRDKWIDGPYLEPVMYIFPAIIVIYIVYTIIISNNTFLAITNKRIIKRTGFFSKNFIHYSLKNIGTIEVVGSIVDNKNTATLFICVKDYHIDNSGNNMINRLKVDSLCNAYEAYNILSELADGNNENIRIKIEK